jgi:hypothetical protein
MLAERLNEAWEASRKSVPIDPVMRFSSEGLVLGAGTILAKSRAPGRNVSIDPQEPRLQALLAAAHLSRPAGTALSHLCKAAERWNEGNDALASIHLSLSNVERLKWPIADARRLFLADGLLKAGFSASVMISTIEAGDPSFEMHKYDPDQPRVPAGSGRTSGEWTSTGDGSSGPPSAAVTASTESNGVIANVHACKIAQLDCIDDAIYAARNDPANDNLPRFLDITNCRSAGFWCDQLSWIVEDLPLPSSAAVRFPNNGVVLIDKGVVDRYYPAHPNGSPPKIRRSSAGWSQLGESEIHKMEGLQSPPCNMEPDETISAESGAFSDCLKPISALAARTNGRVTEQTFSLSPQWGKVVRAKIVSDHEGSPTTACVISWCASDGSLKIALTIDGCCGS